MEQNNIITVQILKTIEKLPILKAIEELLKLCEKTNFVCYRIDIDNEQNCIYPFITSKKTAKYIRNQGDDNGTK